MDNPLSTEHNIRQRQVHNIIIDIAPEEKLYTDLYEIINLISKDYTVYLCMNNANLIFNQMVANKFEKNEAVIAMKSIQNLLLTNSSIETIVVTDSDLSQEFIKKSGFNCFFFDSRYKGDFREKKRSKIFNNMNILPELIANHN